MATAPVEPRAVFIKRQVVLYSEQSDDRVYPFERPGNVGSVQMVSEIEYARLIATGIGRSADNVPNFTFDNTKNGARLLQELIVSPLTAEVGPVYFDFGDGSPLVFGERVVTGGAQKYVAYHVYATDGTFTIRALPTGHAPQSASVSIANIAPTITNLTPNNIPINYPSDPFKVIIQGDNYNEKTVIHFDGVPYDTTFIDQTHVSIYIHPNDQPGPRLVQVRAYNRTLASSNVNFNFVSAAPIVSPPTIESTVPGTIPSTSGPKTMTVNGAGFYYGCTAYVNGDPVPVTRLNDTSFSTSFSPTDYVEPGTGGTVDVTVRYNGVDSEPFSLPIVAL